MASVYEQMFNNATVLVTNFVETTKHEAASFYSAVDPAQLNWLERLWMSWYIKIGDPILATGIMSFVMHEVRRPPLPLALVVVAVDATPS